MLVVRVAVTAVTVLLLLVAAHGAGDASPATDAQASIRFRRPIAAVWLDGGKLLCVANRRSGTISLLDVEQRRVLSETPVATSLSDLALSPSGPRLIVLDDSEHRAILLKQDEGRLLPVAEVPVPRFPVSALISADGSRAYVASLWSRSVTRLTLPNMNTPEDGHVRLVAETSLPLPFPPRLQLLLPDQNKLILADAFGGRLAVVDVTEWKLESVREIHGHNIRGMLASRDGQQLYLAHQILDSAAPTTRENVVHGLLMKNVLRTIELNELLDPTFDWSRATQAHVELGRIGDGAGDPSAIAALDDRKLVVALSGVDEVEVYDTGGYADYRVAVGERPTVALPVPGSHGQRVAVLNTLGDSVSLVKLGASPEVQTIPLGPDPEPGPQDRGERLFYNARLSNENWFSCHSCHPDGYTNGLRADTAGDGSFRAPKRVLSLLGVRDTDRWAWNAQFKELHDQVRQSVESTMQARTVAPQQVNDLTAFLHELQPPPPLQPAGASADDLSQIERGRAVFQRQGCAQCHVPPLTYTSPEPYDVGLEDELGQRKFNPPSLRGVGQAAAFFHDGRAKRLEDVFRVHGHQLDGNLSDSDIDDLLRFLRSL